MNKIKQSFKSEWEAEAIKLVTKSAITGWLISAAIIPFFSIFEIQYGYNHFINCLIGYSSVSLFVILIAFFKKKYSLPLLIERYGIAIIITLSCSVMTTITKAENVHIYLMTVSIVSLVRGLFFLEKMKKLILISLINLAIVFAFIIIGRKEPFFEIPNIGSTLFFSLILLMFAYAGMNTKYNLTKENFINELKLKRSLKIIAEKNKQITDSINYAKRIQEAKLSKREDIYSLFPNSFLLFKPKDIVSGDFYYFQKSVRNEDNETGEKTEIIFIAAADCTGHGVPGALMSMIGYEKLNEAVLKTNDTSEILSQLNIGIKKSLRQTSSHDSTPDGMDIALCSLDTKKRIIKYAGANRPIWIMRKDFSTVEEIKATKKAIGGFTDDSQQYVTHDLQLNDGDTFYIFSDGYTDTFSGKNSKKITTKKFKQILYDIRHQTMPEQEQHLEEFVENWKDGTEQIDDILVIGVRL